MASALALDVAHLGRSGRSGVVVVVALPRPRVEVVVLIELEDEEVCEGRHRGPGGSISRGGGVGGGEARSRGAQRRAMPSIAKVVVKVLDVVSW